MQLRIRMPSGIQKYEVKITDRLFSLREEIAKRESVTADRVTMFYNDTAIHSDDSVQSLGESIHSHLTCGEVKYSKSEVGKFVPTALPTLQ